MRAPFFALAILGVNIGWATWAPRAWGEEPPSPERLKAAAVEYDAGRRAYIAADYASAATHFENAFHDAPRAEALRSAIRAHKAAKDMARASTLAALALERYPGDGPTSQLAREVLDEGVPRLGALLVTCAPACGVAVDGRAVTLEDAENARVYVEPGRHAVSVGWSDGGRRAVNVEAKAGAKESLRFEAPPREAKGPDRPNGENGKGDKGGDGTARPEPPREKPLSPVVFFVGAGLTVAAAGITVWSGLDTLNNPGPDAVRAQCAGLGEACPAYQTGRDAQLRTNVLLGGTAALGVATAAVGLFFTQWTGGGTSVAVAPAWGTDGPGLSMIGRF